MKILVIENVGALLDLIINLENEGHEVRWYVKRKRERDVGQGFTDASDNRIEKWSPSVTWADVIVFGDAGFGQSAAGLKKQGRLVIGGSPAVDRLALDPLFRAKTADSLGLKSKVSGDIHMTVGAFFNGYNWLKPIFQGWKFKGFMSDKLGPKISMGTAGKWIGKSKLFNETLRKFEVFLKANNYTGYVEADCIIDGGRPYLADIICSLAGPTSLLINELHREPWGNFLERIARGAIKQVKVMSRYGVGVRAFTLPAPAMGATDVFNGTPIDLKKGLDHIHLAQMKQMGEYIMTAGTSGFMCVTTGHAITLEMAKKRAYETMESVIAPNIMYRKDIGMVYKRKMDSLRKWGYV